LLTGILNWSCSLSCTRVKVCCPAFSESLYQFRLLHAGVGIRHSSLNLRARARGPFRSPWLPHGTKVLQEHWLIDRSLYITPCRHRSKLSTIQAGSCLRGRWISDTVVSHNLQLHQQTDAVDSWLEIRYHSLCISTPTCTPNTVQHLPPCASVTASNARDVIPVRLPFSMFGSDSQLQDLARGTLVGPYGDLL